MIKGNSSWDNLKFRKQGTEEWVTATPYDNLTSRMSNKKSRHNRVWFHFHKVQTQPKLTRGANSQSHACPLWGDEIGKGAREHLEGWWWQCFASRPRCGNALTLWRSKLPTFDLCTLMYVFILPESVYHKKKKEKYGYIKLNMPEVHVINSETIYVYIGVEQGSK